MDPLQRIQILPDAVKKKIAAGEVIEGPHSVVKELMENSIDAGASEINVEILDSGLKKIAVRDNGCGIHSDDLPMAVMEHATSKIRDLADIESISSLGFRGEALSSISAVSRVTVLSRAGDGETGARMVCREGSIEVSDYAGPRGTAVVVENLFYSTPARKKFLKGKAAELRNIKNVFLKIALAHPGTSFSLNSEDKRLLTLDAAPGREERIAQVFGRETLQRLYGASVSDLKVRVDGFLSRPDFLKSSRSMQILYVNDRLIEYRYLGYLLSRAYEAVAPRGRYPAAIIFLKMDPSLIDVNIHPAKREVKFFDGRYVDGLIEGLCRKVLGGRVHTMDERAISEARRDPPAAPLPANGAGPGAPELSLFGPALSVMSEGETHPGPPPALVSEGAAVYGGPVGAREVKILGVIFGAYVVFESGDTLHFMDFHAAHERLIFDDLVRRPRVLETQELIFPVPVELPPGDIDLLREHAAAIAEIGFDMDFFPQNTVIIRGVPDVAGKADVEGFFLDVAASLRDGERGPSGMRQGLLMKVACHAAKRSGDELSSADVRRIIEESTGGSHELRYPHGRPFLFKLEKRDLERIFKRS
jgi:DNA mismatch repair protein MutL